MCPREKPTHAPEDKHNIFLAVLAYHNSPKPETAQMLIDKRKDAQIVAYSYGIRDCTENESIQLCASKWMNLRNTLLSEKSASQTIHV